MTHKHKWKENVRNDPSSMIPKGAREFYTVFTLLTILILFVWFTGMVVKLTMICGKADRSLQKGGRDGSFKSTELVIPCLMESEGTKKLL